MGGTTRPIALRPGRARRIARTRRSGQVLILTLVGMTLLVGLVFYVYNVGDQVNRRLEMQGAADAVAVTGAGWMARSMNVVAMDNVGTAKMLSLVPILDAQPLGSEMAYHEVSAWEQMLASIVAQPRIDPLASGATEQYLRDGTESLRARMATQRDILAPFAQAINLPNFDMETITHWEKRGMGSGTPHGMLWRAAVTMEEFSRSAVESAGPLAQQRASRMGQRDSATAAFLVPVAPEMPAHVGHYLDFQPTLQGLCEVRSDYGTMQPTGGNGGAIPDFAYPHRLGPWARLHRWRDYFQEFIETGRQWDAGTPGRGATGGIGSRVTSIGGRTVGRRATSPNDRGRAGHWNRQGYHELQGYRTYGPYAWARRHIHWWARGNNEDPGKLRDTYYYEYLSRLAGIKLDYMFPSDGVPPPSVEIHKPNWVVGYPQCKAIGENPDNQVTSTMLYVVEIASRYPDGAAGFLSQGSFRTNGDYPIAQWVGGWFDPDLLVDPNYPNYQKVSDYVWREETTYWTEEDHELGIGRETIPPGDPAGEAVKHTVYYYQWVFFGGIDIGGTIEVSNPANWDSVDWQQQALPQPILIDTSQGDYGGDDPDVGWRREKFTFLGVARKHTEAPVWPQRFRHVNPIEGMITIAQAKLFNNQSWGLWTQDWQVQLMPVTRLGPESDPQSWTALLNDGVTEAASVDAVDAAEVETAYQYLSAIDPDMARIYMTH
ncbi:MAG TPA: Tad domain-containing protein [Phycisphaerae bacterium]|nr:Tad domain-containing protein [Phycisphaerae bacterium]